MNILLQVVTVTPQRKPEPLIHSNLMVFNLNGKNLKNEVKVKCFMNELIKEWVNNKVHDLLALLNLCLPVAVELKLHKELD